MTDDEKIDEIQRDHIPTLLAQRHLAMGAHLEVQAAVLPMRLKPEKPRRDGAPDTVFSLPIIWGDRTGLVLA